MNNATTADRTKNRRIAIIVFAFFAIAMIGSCLATKWFVIGAAISTGMGTPTSKIPGMVCAGVAFASPFYSAFLLSIVGVSPARKMVFAVLWMATIMVAFLVGNTAYLYDDTPVLLSLNTLYALPAVALGWFVPFGLAGAFKGWRLEFPGSHGTDREARITISNMLSLTFVVSLCFFALQFRQQGSHMTWLTGILVAMLLGALGIPLVWVIMRIRYFTVFYLLIGGTTYFLFHLFIISSGGGPWAVPLAVFLATFVLTLLGGFVLARLTGMQLVTKAQRNHG